MLSSSGPVSWETRRVKLPESLYTRLTAPMYNAPVLWCTVRWLKTQSRRSGWKLLYVCPLQRATIAKSQKPRRVTAGPSLRSGDKVLRVARLPSMFNRPTKKKKLPRKLSECRAGIDGQDLRLCVAKGKRAGQIFARVFTCFCKKKKKREKREQNVSHPTVTRTPLPKTSMSQWKKKALH